MKIPNKFNRMGISVTADEALQPLTFTAVQDGASINLRTSGSPNVSGLQYKTTGDWMPYTANTVINLSHAGDKIQFQNTNQALSTTTSNYAYFQGNTKKISASGNVMSLVNYIDYCPNNFCFYRLFANCTSLITAPELPATTLTNWCYAYMFVGCTSLITAPELPATTLTNWCYYGLFSGCTSLITAPELPATTLASYCYKETFKDCSNLINGPSSLPATTLASNCYEKMFSTCKKMITNYDLPALTPAYQAYYNMFSNCWQMTSCKIHLTTLINKAAHSMFEGCKKLSNIQVNFSSWVDGATDYWVNYVASSGTFTKPSALSETYGNSKIPSNWTVVNK